MGLHGCWLCSVPLLHGAPWMLAVLRSTDTNVADKNRHYNSIHHVSRADQNCAVLKRAENIMRHVEMWSVVRQKGTVRASRKMCSGLKDSVTKSCKFISGVKHHKQRIMLAKHETCHTHKHKHTHTHRQPHEHEQDGQQTHLKIRLI